MIVAVLTLALGVGANRERDLMATIQTAADWRKEWFQIADATYLNTAAHAAIPRVALHAVQTSIEANKSPHHMDDAVFFEAPSRIRASLSKLIGAKPEEIALTTGASTGVAAVAHFLRWKPGDEIITAKGQKGRQAMDRQAGGEHYHRRGQTSRA